MRNDILLPSRIIGSCVALLLPLSAWVLVTWVCNYLKGL
jgi:hypothetical protein